MTDIKPVLMEKHEFECGDEMLLVERFEIFRFFLTLKH